jgi:hypothetical protein
MVPADWGIERGGKVLNLLQEETVPVVAKPKQQLLPLLVVLFLISYGLLAFLVVEQGRTIANQRSLIQQLFHDSVELTSLKGKNLNQQHPVRPATPLKSQPQVQTPSSQSQAPSSQANPRENVAVQKRTGRLQKVLPLKPPKDTEDTPDERRNRSLV